MKTVITGASSGIGLAVTELLLGEGRSVWGCSRGAAHPGGKPADPRRYQHTEVDVRSPESVADFAEAVKKTWGTVDTLILSAGIMRDSESIEDESPDSWRDTIDTNLSGSFYCLRYFLPLLSDEMPRVVLLTGALGRIADGMSGGEVVAYRVSKAGIAALTMTAHQEYSDRGITVSAYDPGWVSTPLGGSDAPVSPDEAAASLVGVVRSMTPDSHGGRCVNAEGAVVPW